MWLLRDVTRGTAVLVVSVKYGGKARLHEQFFERFKLFDTTTHVSSSSDDDLGPEDSATIEPYQFEPVDGEHRDDSQTDELVDDDPQNDPRLGNTDW